MAYAEIQDIEDRIARDLTPDEKTVVPALLEDAAIIIDCYNPDADAEARKVVSCRMVIRQLGTGDSYGVPIGASQGSMSALGYSQSWQISSGVSGELYLSRLDKKLLGKGNSIGAYSPVEEMASDV